MTINYLNHLSISVTEDTRLPEGSAVLTLIGLDRAAGNVEICLRRLNPPGHLGVHGWQGPEVWLQLEQSWAENHLLRMVVPEHLAIDIDAMPHEFRVRNQGFTSPRMRFTWPFPLPIDPDCLTEGCEVRTPDPINVVLVDPVRSVTVEGDASAEEAAQAEQNRLEAVAAAERQRQADEAAQAELNRLEAVAAAERQRQADEAAQAEQNQLEALAAAERQPQVTEPLSQTGTENQAGRNLSGSGQGLGKTIRLLSMGLSAVAAVVFIWPVKGVVDQKEAVVQIEAHDDHAQVTAGDTVVIPVLQNDTGRDLKLVLVGLPSLGTVKLTGDSLTYTANPDSVGTDIFEYQVRGDKSVSAAAKVKVLVAAKPDSSAPRAAVPSHRPPPPLADCQIPAVSTQSSNVPKNLLKLEVAKAQMELQAGNSAEAMAILKAASEKGNGLAAQTMGEWLDPTGTTLGNMPACAAEWYKLAALLGAQPTVQHERLINWAVLQAPKGNRAAQDLLDRR